MEEQCVTFMTQWGVVISERIEVLEDGRTKMYKPLKVKPVNDGVSLDPFFIKEEWIIVRTELLEMQLETNKVIAESYQKARVKIFSGIIL